MLIWYYFILSTPVFEGFVLDIVKPCGTAGKHTRLPTYQYRPYMVLLLYSTTELGTL